MNENQAAKECTEEEISQMVTEPWNSELIETQTKIIHSDFLMTKD